jgi:hypothetical protein
MNSSDLVDDGSIIVPGKGSDHDPVHFRLQHPNIYLLGRIIDPSSAKSDEFISLFCADSDSI